MTQVLADGPPALEALTSVWPRQASTSLLDGESYRADRRRQEFSLGQAAPVSASNALMADPIVG